MANEIRIRRNNIGGVTTDNPLSNVATTINSPGFVDLPTVDTTSHLLLVLDPLETSGPAEIVRVTAHTAAASSCTIVRGAEGSAARTHTAGTTWYHGAVSSDTIEVLTSSTRPATPYRGELIFETDTNSFVGRDTADAWTTAVSMGQWASSTPTLGADTTAPTLGTASYTQQRFTKFGKTIMCESLFVFGTAGAAAGSGFYRIPLPAGMTAVAQTNSQAHASGSAYLFDQSAAVVRTGTVSVDTNSQIARVFFDGGGAVNLVSNSAPWIWAANDEIHVFFIYETSV